MPKQRIGLIGRRLAGVIAAFVGCIVVGVAYHDAHGPAVASALLAIVCVFLSNGANGSSAFGLLLGTFDAWIGVCVAAGLGGLVFLGTGAEVAAVVATGVAGLVWRTRWTVPSLDTAASKRLMERVVVASWRDHPGFLLGVRRRPSADMPAPVGFLLDTNVQAADVHAFAGYVAFCQQPFRLQVLFADDAYEPYTVSEYVSPRLATVVDVGALRALDTSTPIWSLPTSAHERLAFEAQIAHA